MNQTVGGIYTMDGLIFGLIQEIKEDTITIVYPSMLLPTQNGMAVHGLLHACEDQTLIIKRDKLLSDQILTLQPDVEQLFKKVNKLDSGIITPQDQKIIH